MLTSIMLISTSIITMNMSKVYPKFNMIGENNETKNLLIVGSFHKVVCDMVFIYI